MVQNKGFDAETEKEGDGDGESNDAADHNHTPFILHGEDAETLIKQLQTLPNGSRRLSGPARRSSKANWTEEEDDILRDAVQRYNGKSWKKIAKSLPGRKDVQCLHRWQKVLNPDLVKGPWSKEEDSLLIELVGKQGKKKWSEIAEHLPGRMGKQCRERWFNHLNPEINKSAWTKEEEMILIESHAIYGNKWSEIAKLLPGRTENSVKNHWNGSLKKKVDYLANASALNHPRPYSDNQKTEAVVEARQNPTTNDKATVDNGNNGEPFCLDLTIGNAYSHHPSTNNPVRPSPPTCGKTETFQDDLKTHVTTGQPGVLNCPPFDENVPAHGKNGDDNRIASKSLPPFPNSPSDNYKIMSRSIKPRRHSDICGMQQNSSYYTGLCYKPIEKEDVDVFMSTGRFPSVEGYIRQPNRSVSVPPSSSSRSQMRVSSDLHSKTESILRIAAISYENAPSIMRKRGIQNLQKDPSITDNDIGSLNRMFGVDGAPKLDNGDGDDQVRTLTEAVHLSPKYQKLEKNEAIKSVGKCLEREFSVA